MFSLLGIIALSRLYPRASSGDGPTAEQERRVNSGLIDPLACAAVERREGARAYVIGAWSTLARCSGVPFPPRKPGRGENTPRVRRSAPAPSRRSAPSRESDGWVERKRSLSAGERKARSATVAR